MFAFMGLDLLEVHRLKSLPFDKPRFTKKKKKFLKQYIYSLRKGRKVKKKTKPKLRKISRMKEQAWGLKSKIIRRTAADEWGRVACYACDSLHMWKDVDVGHYKHGHYRHTFLMDDNLRVECKRCNKYLSGNLTIYGERLLKEIGPERFEALTYWHNQPFKPTREYYQKHIDTYKAKLEELDARNMGQVSPPAVSGDLSSEFPGQSAA